MKNVFIFILLAVVSATVTKCGFNPADYKVEVVPLQKNKNVKASETFEPIRFHKHLFDMPSITEKVEKTIIDSVAEDVLSKISSFVNVQRETVNIKVEINEIDKGYPIPASHKDPGIENTDYVVYFMERNCGEDSATIAAAGPKLVDSSNRPYVGYVYLCISKAESMKTDKEYYEVVVLHEMMHALGFGTLFSYIGHTLHNVTVNGIDFKELQTDKVVAAVREHYNCDSMTGALLENDGNEGTANSHWERTLYNGELMTGWISSNEKNILSKMTLSWLEDSGFYKVDYSVAKDLDYGKNKGCEMAGMKCKDSNNKPIGDFCDESKESQCTYNYKGQGICKKLPQNGLNCPVVTMYLDGLCSDGTFKNDTTDHIYGRYHGVNGFCQYNDDFIIKGYTTTTTQMCARIQCPDSTPDEYQIVVCPLEGGCTKNDDYKVVTCKNEGEVITVDGYKGNIICGKREIVCSNNNGYDSSVEIIIPNNDPSSTTSPSTTTTTKDPPDEPDTSSTTAPSTATTTDSNSSNESHMYKICGALFFVSLTLFLL